MPSSSAKITLRRAAPNLPGTTHTVRFRRVHGNALGSKYARPPADTHQLYIAANKRRCWRPAGSSPHAAGFFAKHRFCRSNVKANAPGFRASPDIAHAGCNRGSAPGTENRRQYIRKRRRLHRAVQIAPASRPAAPVSSLGAGVSKNRIALRSHFSKAQYRSHADSGREWPADAE